MIPTVISQPAQPGALLPGVGKAGAQKTSPEKTTDDAAPDATNESFAALFAQQIRPDALPLATVLVQPVPAVRATTDEVSAPVADAPVRFAAQPELPIHGLVADAASVPPAANDPAQDNRTPTSNVTVAPDSTAPEPATAAEPSLEAVKTGDLDLLAEWVKADPTVLRMQTGQAESTVRAAFVQVATPAMPNAQPTGKPVAREDVAPGRSEAILPGTATQRSSEAGQRQGHEFDGETPKDGHETEQRDAQPGAVRPAQERAALLGQEIAARMQDARATQAPRSAPQADAVPNAHPTADGTGLVMHGTLSGGAVSHDPAAPPAGRVVSAEAAGGVRADEPAIKPQASSVRVELPELGSGARLHVSVRGSDVQARLVSPDAARLDPALLDVRQELATKGLTLSRTSIEAPLSAPSAGQPTSSGNEQGESREQSGQQGHQGGRQEEGRRRDEQPKHAFQKAFSNSSSSFPNSK